MILNDFNASDGLEQLEAIWKYGVVAPEREDEVHRYKRYQIHTFSVEQVWRKEYNMRRAFNSFAITHTKVMRSYLN